jgi:hypothetical protein
LGKRNRERIARIERGEEQSIASKAKGIPEKTVSRIQSLAEKTVGKVMAPMFRRQTLVQQVATARKLMSKVGVVNFRANLLKDGGLPEDIGDLFKKGMKTEEVKAFYWQCPEFVVFWGDIQCTEDMLDAIIKAQASKWEKPK